MTFQARGNDANGDPLGAWADEFSVSADIKWLRGSEAALSQRLEGRQPVAIVIRDSSQSRQITTGWRVVNARNTAQTFNITAASPSPDRGFMDVLAVAGVATG